ncbi:hypothetical protein [Saccharothrix sp. HUAS TT1]|uniref:hypothetical protein n=1 Tax=unclassified Saccharothrix TaxID=2593673 RepID=UPI00345BBFFD
MTSNDDTQPIPTRPTGTRPTSTGRDPRVLRLRDALMPALAGVLFTAGALLSLHRGVDPGAVLVQASLAGYALRAALLTVTTCRRVARWARARDRWAADPDAGHLPDYPRTARPSRRRTQLVFSALVVAPAAALLCLIGGQALQLLVTSLLAGGTLREVGALLDARFHPGRALPHPRP